MIATFLKQIVFLKDYKNSIYFYFPVCLSEWAVFTEKHDHNA
jgi:hypothetical protein